jgi:hypothetical protein
LYRSRRSAAGVIQTSSTFITLLSFAQYLVPLGVLQLYLLTQKQRGARGLFAMAAGLLILTLAMLGGIAAAAAIMWLPHL